MQESQKHNSINGWKLKTRSYRENSEYRWLLFEDIELEQKQKNASVNGKQPNCGSFRFGNVHICISFIFGDFQLGKKEKVTYYG